MTRRQLEIGLIGVAMALAIALMVRLALRHHRAKARAAQASQATSRGRVTLAEGLAARELRLGAPAYLRIFKRERELELWVEHEASQRFVLLATFRICAASGVLGPKLREGDRQAPEGFYRVPLEMLHPGSRYHLAFNLGFPNAYDRAHGRTGSYLMVHGGCASIGCYAMTDEGIEPIYTVVEAALRGGQPAVPVHCFPFRLTPAALAAERAHPWHGFWTELEPAYRHFEATRRPPRVAVEGRRYVVSPGMD